VNNPLILSMHLNLSVKKCELLLGDGLYLVLSEEEADSFVKIYVNQNLWTFATAFLLKYSCLNAETHGLLKAYQDIKGKDANELIRSFIIDMDGLIEFLVSTFGRGKLLGTENYEEVHVGDYLVYKAF